MKNREIKEKPDKSAVVYLMCGIFQERRRVAISNAKRQWEVMQSSLTTRTPRNTNNMPDLYASHVTTVNNSDVTNDDEDTNSTPESRR